MHQWGSRYTPGGLGRSGKVGRRPLRRQQHRSAGGSFWQHGRDLREWHLKVSCGMAPLCRRCTLGRRSRTPDERAGGFRLESYTPRTLTAVSHSSGRKQSIGPERWLYDANQRRSRASTIPYGHASSASPARGSTACPPEAATNRRTQLGPRAARDKCQRPCGALIL